MDMNVAFSRGKSAEERKKWFVNTTDALGICQKGCRGYRAVGVFRIERISC